MISKAVVTGANGLVGRHLVKALQQRDVEVAAVDIAPGETGTGTHVRDVRQPAALDDLLSAETVVFHLAAFTSVAKSVESPRADFDVNVRGTFEVLESLRRCGGRLVFSSSSAVFDPSSPLPHAENAPKRPSSPYGASKLCGEAYCHVYHHNYGLDIRIARLFNVYGPGMRQYAIYDFYCKIRAAKATFQVLGDGEQVRDLLYVDDAVQAYLQIAESGCSGEDYNVASGKPVRILDLAQTMTELMGRSDLSIETTGKSFPGDVRKWYANVTKLHQIGFSPDVPLEDGLRRTISTLDRENV